MGATSPGAVAAGFSAGVKHHMLGFQHGADRGQGLRNQLAQDSPGHRKRPGHDCLDQYRWLRRTAGPLRELRRKRIRSIHRSNISQDLSPIEFKRLPMNQPQGVESSCQCLRRLFHDNFLEGSRRSGQPL